MTYYFVGYVIEHSHITHHRDTECVASWREQPLLNASYGIQSRRKKKIAVSFQFFFFFNQSSHFDFRKLFLSCFSFIYLFIYLSYQASHFSFFSWPLVLLFLFFCCLLLRFEFIFSFLLSLSWGWFSIPILPADLSLEHFLLNLSQCDVFFFFSIPRYVKKNKTKTQMCIEKKYEINKMIFILSYYTMIITFKLHCVLCFSPNRSGKRKSYETFLKYPFLRIRKMGPLKFFSFRSFLFRVKLCNSS